MTASTLTNTDIISCPKCGGQMYDNRATKKNVKQPDFKCKNYRVCDGVIWPAKNGAPPVAAAPSAEPAKPKMRDAYKQLTEWVISDILPIYDAEFGGGVCGPDVTAAITATLFIQACYAGKVE